MTQQTTKSGPPSLELDIGYSILEHKPSIKVKIPQGYFSGGRTALLFPLRALRVWRIRLRAWCDARKGIHLGTSKAPALVQEIQHQGQLKFNELSAAIAEKIASELPRKLRELAPVPFSLEERKQALSSSIQGWLNGYREFLRRLRGDLSRAGREFAAADEALQNFANTANVPKRPRPRRPGLKSVATLLACMAAESFLGFFLFLDSQQAPLRGALVALLISVSNAFLGGLLGAFAAHQLLDGTTRWRRAAGGLFSLAFAAAAVWTNLFVAHQREQTLLDHEHALPQTAFGGVLFVAGLCVWGFAAIKGYRDFSPGSLKHRELWKDWREKRLALRLTKARYRALLLGMQQSAEGIAHQLRGKLEHIVVVHEIRKDQINGLLYDLDCLKAQLDLCRNGILDSVRVLLANYWEANSLRARNSPTLAAGVPVSEPPATAWEPVQPYPLTKPNEAAEAAQAVIVGNIGQIRQLQAEFETDFARVLNQEIPRILEEFKEEEEEMSTPPPSSGPAVVTPMDRRGVVGAPTARASGGGLK